MLYNHICWGKDDDDMITVTKNTFFYIATDVLSLIDHGQVEMLDDVKREMENQSLIKYLRDNYDFQVGKKYKGSDLSIVSGKNEQLVNHAFYQILGGYAGDEYSKWGIENNGLCLVVAWAISIGQAPDVYIEPFISEFNND